MTGVLGSPRRTITFETKCWEGDWRNVLLTDHLADTIAKCGADFDERLVTINNVADPREVAPHAERLVREGVLTGYHVVAEHEAAVLRYFDLTREALGAGYVYSIAELTAIFLCGTDYLLHFSGDAKPMTESGDWVARSVDLMERCPHVKVANLLWNNEHDHEIALAVNTDEHFYVGMGFSDQNYLIRARDFRERIYHHDHPASARYPVYGGELFEKRVDSWMRRHHYLRASWKHAAYVHPCAYDTASDGGPIGSAPTPTPAPQTWMPDVWEWLVENYRPQSVVGFGPDARQALGWFAGRGVEVVAADHDAEHGPWASPQTFDLAIAVNLLEHLSVTGVVNWLDSLAECRRLLLSLPPAEGPMEDGWAEEVVGALRSLGFAHLEAATHGLRRTAAWHPEAPIRASLRFFERVA